MNFGLNMIDHNFMNLYPFGLFNSDLEREVYEESAPVNNGKMILTVFFAHFYLACHICMAKFYSW